MKKSRKAPLEYKRYKDTDINHFVFYKKEFALLKIMIENNFIYGKWLNL
jgi:hypothetical protein